MAISYLHCYVNSRPNVDWNTCGQAATATITDYWRRNPYGLPRDTRDGYNGLYYWNDGRAIDAIKAGGFGPDVAFGLGTTGGSGTPCVAMVSTLMWVTPGPSFKAGRTSGVRSATTWSITDRFRSFLTLD